MDIEEGKIYFVNIRLLETGETIFVVKFADGSELKCVQEWFENYFELMK
jgi:hypothetical protein